MRNATTGCELAMRMRARRDGLLIKSPRVGTVVVISLTLSRWRSCGDRATGCRARLPDPRTAVSVDVLPLRLERPKSSSVASADYLSRPRGPSTVERPRSAGPAGQIPKVGGGRTRDLAHAREKQRAGVESLSERADPWPQSLRGHAGARARASRALSFWHTAPTAIGDRTLPGGGPNRCTTTIRAWSAGCQPGRRCHRRSFARR